MDLGAELRSGRFLRLLELIEQLPMACRWREAANTDPEYLDQLIETLAEHGDDPEKEKERPQWRPALREYNLTHIMLDRLISLVGDLLRAQGADMEPEEYMFPRPFNPEEEAKALLEIAEEHDKILNVFSFCKPSE